MDSKDCVVPFCSAKKSMDLFLAKSENFLHVRFHLDLVRKPSHETERKSELDRVRDQCPAVARFKTMLMPPQLVRSAQLQIDKTMRRVPFHNLTGPAQRNPMDAQAVV